MDYQDATAADDINETNFGSNRCLEFYICPFSRRTDYNENRPG